MPPKSAQSEKVNLNDPKAIFSSGTFNFRNGDIYEGEYVAPKSLSIFKHGNGTYKSDDKQVYEAQWELDLIANEQPIRITYADNSRYEGSLLNHTYSGPATYKFPDGSKIECEFVGNKPVGNIRLVDPVSKIWKGTTDQEHAILFPVNQFLDNIPKDLGFYSFMNDYKISPPEKQKSDYDEITHGEDNELEGTLVDNGEVVKKISSEK